MEQDQEAELNALVAHDDDDDCECHDNMDDDLVCDDNGVDVHARDAHAYDDDHDDRDYRDGYGDNGAHYDQIQVLAEDRHLADEHALKRNCHRMEMAAPTMYSKANEDEDSKRLVLVAKHLDLIGAVFVLFHLR